ncbi:MAG: amino acid adenylation domain-containing protein [Terriglobales bacterium]
MNPVYSAQECQLSDAQSGIWIAQAIDPASPAFNIAEYVDICGQLRPDLFAAALRQVVNESDALRVRISSQPEGVRQFVTVLSDWELPVIDLSSQTEPFVAADVWMREDLARPVQPDLEPLFFYALLRLGPERFFWYVRYHHLCMDGFGGALIAKRAAEIYSALVQNNPVPPCTFQPSLNLLDEEEKYRRTARKRDREYWLAVLSAPPDAVTLSGKSPGRSRTFVRHRGCLSAELTVSLASMGKMFGASLTQVIETAATLYLHRLTGADDVILGLPLTARVGRKVRNIPGMASNILPLRINFSQSGTFADLVTQVVKRKAEMMRHQRYRAEDLRHDLGLQPSNPNINGLLVNVMSFDYDLNFTGCKATTHNLSNGPVEEFAIVVYDRQDGSDPRIDFDANPAHYTREEVAAHQQRFISLLQQLVSPELPLAAYGLLLPDELNTVISSFNATVHPVTEATLPQLVEVQVARTPDLTAIVFDERSLTYAELNARANQLARHLCTMDIGPEALVGICLPRSTEMVVALLAVLKTGGAYLPLDPEYPQARLAEMLQDAAPACVLTTSALSLRLPQNAKAIVLDSADITQTLHHAPDHNLSDAERRRALLPQHPAYVIYTSGSTGRPKGVVIEHRSVATFIAWAGSVFSGEEWSGVLASTSISFDLSVFELFATLSHGGTVLLANSALDLPTLPARDQVRLINTVPSAARSLLDSGSLPSSLCTVNLAGEALPNALVQALYGREHIKRVLNLYGPSEDTTYSTFGLCSRKAQHEPGIGSPIWNTRAYVLDHYLQALPVGSTGELYLSGAGLARGYLNRPGLTAERFIADPFFPSARMYRTGDLVCLQPDGTLEFIGRADQQVKIRGFRIELGEIEAALTAQPEIKQAIVIARENGASGKQVVAYIVLADEKPFDQPALQQSLAERLPRHMLPSAIVVLPALPLTPNGKIDRRALPAPEWRGNSNAPPRTPDEELLCRIFGEVLALDRIGIHDSFFDLGGHSLMAMQLLSRIHATFGIDLPTRFFFDSPTVAQLATQFGRFEKDNLAIGAQRRPERLPVSFSQQRLWFIDQLDGSSAQYHIPEALRLRGDLDVAALKFALNEMIGRHESLRTCFASIDGEPAQVIRPRLTLEVPLIDLSTVNSSQQQQDLKAALHKEWEEPFDLTRGPLLRAKLIKLSAQEHIFLRRFHHIVADGWSEEIFNREFAAMYTAFREGRQPILSPLPLQYADYVLWQRSAAAEPRRSAALEYWSKQLLEAPDQLDLPRDRPRPARQSFAGELLHLTFPEDQLSALEHLARSNGCTLYMALVAAFSVLLQRYSGQNDVLIGTPVANRQDPRLEKVIGYFSSAIVMRMRLDPEQSFSDLLKQTRTTALDAYRHQDVPFEQLAREVSSQRGLNYPPVFQVMFALQNAPASMHALSGLQVEPVVDDQPRVRLDLELYAWQRENKLELYWIYNRDLFDRWRIEQMAGDFRRLLESVIAGSNLALRNLQMISSADRRRMLNEWNQTAADYPTDSCVHHLFEHQAARTPLAIVAELAEQRMTYGELDRRANQVAHHLVKLGVGPDIRVGICMERGLDLLAALLGVLKADGAYVPLDPAYPQERLDYMLGDSGAGLVLTQSTMVSNLPSGHAKVIALDANWDQIAQEPHHPPAAEVNPENLAYIIYTSGSTGRPKGVAVEHRQVCNQLFWAGEVLSLGPTDCVLQKASFSFDASILEIFLPLVYGSRIAIAAPGGERDADYLLQLAIEKSVSYVDLAPSLLDALLDHPQIQQWKSLRIISSGAEALKPELVDVFYEKLSAELWNTYGPTETTVQSTYARCAPHARTVPIGKPVANTSLDVLDSHLELTPVGVAGELYIGGAGVTRGYWNRPGLTAEKFIADPFTPGAGARLYRTGDLVRWMPDGNLEFLGRVDHQVKIRGFRIELGEIETALRTHDGIADAIVMVQERGSVKQLAAYVIAQQSGSSPDIDLAETLQRYLRRLLPSYMVPSVISVLSSWPLTPSGKVDRRALPSLAQKSHEQLPPRTPEEEVLCAVFADVLGAERVGIHDNFFELGGHSLLAAKLVSRVRTALGKEVSIRVLFESPTVAELVEKLNEAQTVRPALMAKARPERLRLSYAQQRLWFLYQMEGPGATYNIPLALRLEGELNHGALEQALGDVVERHEALRTVFPEKEGVPYQKVLTGEEAKPKLTVESVDESELKQRLAEAASEGMELERELPLRLWLFRLSENKHVLLLVLHHIAGDGWSLWPLARDLEEAYRARMENKMPEWEPLPVQYGDYTLWQRELLGSESDPESVISRQLEFWKKALEGMPEELLLPTDRARPAVMSYRGGTVPLELDAELHRGLLGVARRSGASLFMVLQAGLAALLSRLGAGEDIPIGTVVAGRSEAELEELVGFFVNTLVLRTDVSGDPTFTQLIERVRRFALEAYSHQEVPFERLVEAVQPERSQSRHPLFQVVLVLQNAPEASVELPGLNIQQVVVPSYQSQFDLSLTLNEHFDSAGNAAGIAGTWEYSLDLFEPESVINLESAFVHILLQAVKEPKQRLRQLEVSLELQGQQSPAHTSSEKVTPAKKPAVTIATGKIGARTRQRESKRPPRTPQEQTFCRLFAELLSLEQVGANQNFFHLGGDSILSIQLVSRARKAGLLLTPRDIFQHQTPEALALAARQVVPGPATPTSIDQEGTLMPTPIIQSLFEQGSAFKRFHQSVLLQVPDDLRETDLVRLLQLLIDHHGSLRLRQSSDRSLQIAPCGSVQAAHCLTILDCASSTESAKTSAREAECNLDPEAGRIVHAVWFRKDKRLLLMIHHLAVDGVSWRILLSDLAAAWKAVVRGETPVLEPVPTPFRHWAKYLSQRSSQQAVLSELDYWQTALSGAPLLSGKSLKPQKDNIASAGNLRWTLPVDLTTAVLTSVPEAFHAQINDVLLTALALAAFQWRRLYSTTDDGTITINLEGHGREPMDSGLDLSRTVGWFTSVFPVRLNLRDIDLQDINLQDINLQDVDHDHSVTAHSAVARALKLIKDQLRGIPNRGLNYGLLRYLNPETARDLAALPSPQLAFNYLGRFTTQEGAPWLPTGDDAGFSGGADPEMPLLHFIEIDAVVADGCEGPRLTANFSWASNHLEESAIRDLASFWQRGLESIAKYTCRRGNGGHSVSDFPLVALSLSHVERIEAAFPSLVDILPLSSLQEGLLFHSLYGTGADVYTVQTNLELEGEIFPERLRESVEVLLMRYPNLRVSIYREGLEQPVQVVPAAIELPWGEVDLSMMEKEAQSLRCAEIVAAERAEGFTFSSGPLLRFVLIRLAPDRHVLVFTNHHLILDGWSTPLLIGEMLELYGNGMNADKLPRVRPYTDYLAWLKMQDHSAALAAWKNYLADLESPTIMARQPQEARKAETQIPVSCRHDLSAELAAALNAMARERGLTLNTVLQGLWAVLLARLSNRNDIVFGITVSGRSPELAEIEQMVGLFINTVPLRIRLHPGELFLDVLARIQESQSEMLNVYHLGLSEIQREAGFEQLFDTIFVFENYPLDRSLLTRSFAGLRISNVEMRDGAHYPLALMIAPDDRLRVRLDYDPARFAAEYAAGTASRFIRLLQSAVAQPKAPWHQLDLFMDGERCAVLEEFNDTLLPLPATTMAAIFEECAMRSPHSIAIVQGKGSMSYGELNQRANRLAHSLIQKGIGPESLVGVALERSADMVTAIIAVWKAGAAYLPLDSEYPRARLEHMLNDAMPKLVLTKSKLQLRLPQVEGVEFLALDTPEFSDDLERTPAHNPNCKTLPQHPAYVIYTSGSTGVPKGVVITHQGIPSLAASQRERLKMTEQSRILQFASLNFDASFWELLMALSTGATLVLPEQQREGAALYELLVSQKITHALLPVPVLASLEEFGTLPLQWLMNGGEVLSRESVARWSSGLRMINAYGPTEATVCATISLPLSGSSHPPIGCSIHNARVYVLDINLEPVPLGVAGELYISGAGLARGYLKQPALTAERFIADPYAIELGARMYRTGDLACWREDGMLDFVGRADEQVKVRGFRIELGEIEAALRSLPEIADAAVALKEETSLGKQLVAYLVPSNGALPEPAALRHRLNERLPAHMLPAVFMSIEKLPRSPNGKIDRAALPAFARQTSEARAPRSPEETALCGMFAEVLRREQVDVEEDFFSLGGDSLSAMRLVGRVCNAFGVAISLRDFYAASTVSDLAHLIQAIQFTAGRIQANKASLDEEVFEEEEI